ncbi:MAG: repeat protein [Bacteroidetes bacterium]|jgi:PKD repeat protein|nr:repeat protein [Bacteroidota bacterium]
MKMTLKKIAAVILLVLTANFAKAQCQANFTYSIAPGGQVFFFNTSTGTGTNTMVYWNFGDGNNQSGMNLNSVNHTYAYNSNFSVTLWVIDSTSTPGCQSNITQTLAISSATCSGSLSFNYYNGANGNIWFTNSSNGIAPNATYSVAFGDGATQAGSFPASHTYSASGVYTVTMVASGGGCNYTTTQTISVNMNACNINANFSYTVGSNGNVTFASTSTGTVNNAIYYWNFGDGSGTWVGTPINHQFFNNGLFNVTLTVADSNSVWCSDTITQQVNLSGNCFANVNFWMWKDSSALPAITWDAYATYPNNMVSTIWSWGDGSTSTGLFPSHTYSAAGFYNICVTVSVACGATAQACYNANIWKSTGNNAANAIAMVNVKDASTAPTAISKTDVTPIEFVMFPNPSSGEFEIKMNGVEKTSYIKIYNVLGQEVYSETVESSDASVHNKIDLSNVNGGTYFVKVISGNASKNSKLIISK